MPIWLGMRPFSPMRLFCLCRQTSCELFAKVCPTWAIPIALSSRCISVECALGWVLFIYLFIYLFVLCVQSYPFVYGRPKKQRSMCPPKVSPRHKVGDWSEVIKSNCVFIFFFLAASMQRLTQSKTDFSNPFILNKTIFIKYQRHQGALQSWVNHATGCRASHRHLWHWNPSSAPE